MAITHYYFQVLPASRILLEETELRELTELLGSGFPSPTVDIEARLRSKNASAQDVRQFLAEVQKVERPIEKLTFFVTNSGMERPIVMVRLARDEAWVYSESEDDDSARVKLNEVHNWFRRRGRWYASLNYVRRPLGAASLVLIGVVIFYWLMKLLYEIAFSAVGRSSNLSSSHIELTVIVFLGLLIGVATASLGATVFLWLFRRLLPYAVLREDTAMHADGKSVFQDLATFATVIAAIIGIVAAIFTIISSIIAALPHVK